MRFLARALILLLLIAPLAHADDGALGKPPAKVVHGAEYLANCRDILSISSADYEKHLVEAATNESQVLQLLYDGGLIFSKLFNEAFLQAVDTRVQSQGAIAQFKQLKYEKKSNFLKQFAQNLANLARLSTADMNAFIWQMLDIESELSATAQNSSDLKGQIRYDQVSKLVQTLKGAPNRALIEKTLRDIVTDSLLISARQLFIGSLNHSTTNIDADEMLILPVSGAVVGAIAGSIINVLLSVAYQDTVVPDNVQTNVIVASTLIGVLVPILAIARDRFLRRGMRASIKANETEKVFYVLPRATSEERLELAGLLRDFLESPPTNDKKGQKAAKLKKSDWRDENPDNQLSIATVCNSNTCQLSPFQLAYVGDIDMLELQGLLRTFREFVAANSASTLNLRNALLAVQADPSNYEKSMDLRVKLEELRQFSTEVAAAEHELLNQIDQKITQLRTDFASLRAKPFGELRKTPEDRARGLLLLNRVNADLARLDSFSFDVQKYRTSANRLDRYSNATSQWLNELPLTEHGWGQSATDILRQLNQVEATP